jgi:hypothetical protein
MLTQLYGHADAWYESLIKMNSKLENYTISISVDDTAFDTAWNKNRCLE